MPEAARPHRRLAPGRVVLIGMMGSGKSSIGRAMSALTGWPFHDNDVLVERATGRTARELLAVEGEDALRRAEARAMVDGLALPPPVIVATAAGTVLEPENRDAVTSAGFVAWLHAPPEVLAARAVGADHRPWLEEDAVAWFAATIAERGPLYAAMADLQLDTAVLSPEDAARRIVAALATD